LTILTLHPHRGCTRWHWGIQRWTFH